MNPVLRQICFVSISLIFGFTTQAIAKENCKPETKVKIESVKVEVFENGNEKPVTISLPYWLLLAGAENPEMLNFKSDKVNIKQVLAVIQNAPSLGQVLVVDDKPNNSKVIVSIL